MDEDQIYIHVQKCKHLKFKLRVVYAADNYPLNLPVNSFIIVNASPADSIGSLWVMLAKRYAYPVLYFADLLALPLNHVDTLSVSGFNSGKYDLNLIKAYIIPHLLNDRAIQPTVIEKANQFHVFKFSFSIF